MTASASPLTMRKYEESLPLKLLQAREAAMGFFRPILQSIGLTDQQWRIIRALAEHQALEPKQLAELCCILSPSLTGILARLEQQGLVNRERLVEDQRRILVSLTPKALEIFNKITPSLEKRYQQITERFGEENLIQLSNLLVKFAAIETKDL